MIGDYYAPRVGQYLAQGLKDVKAGRPFSTPEMVVRQAKLAYDFQTGFIGQPQGGSSKSGTYPLEPVGDPVKISQALMDKYAGYFASCKYE